MPVAVVDALKTIEIADDNRDRLRRFYRAQGMIEGVIKIAAIIKPRQRIANGVLIRLLILQMRLAIKIKDVIQQNENNQQRGDGFK